MTKDLAFTWYLAAIATLPLSYAVKFMMGRPDITWVDPALAFTASALLFDLLAGGRGGGFPRLRISGAMVIAGLFLLYYLASGIVNGLLGPGSPTLEIFREPTRLFLVAGVAVATRRFASQRSRRRVIFKALGVVLVVQVAVAIYVLLVPLGLPAPQSLTSYSTDYIARQTLWSLPIPVPRLGGTFDESPPFGLFMLSGFFAMCLYAMDEGGRLPIVFGAIALIGVLGSLSTQVILGLGVAVFILSLRSIAATRQPIRSGLLGILAVAVSVFVGDQIAQRLQQERVGPVAGQSIGERTYHSRYAVELASRGPTNLLVGVGPGMYGPTVAKDGQFPATVTPQVAPAELLAETGVVGVFLAALTVLVLTLQIHRHNGLTGIAAFWGTLVAMSLQANWKWAGAFFLIGLLLAERPVRDDREFNRREMEHKADYQ